MLAQRLKFSLGQGIEEHGLLRWLSVKNSPANARDAGDVVRSLNGKIPYRWKWQPTPIFLPGKPHGQRSPEGYRAWGCKESGVTEYLNIHAH